MPENLSRTAARPKVVHIPHQTSVGFEAVVPTDADAKDLGKFIERSRLGRGRIRVQQVFSLRAFEVKWAPTAGMPPLREFVDVVQAWARRKGYDMARDVRELRSGLEALRGGRTAHQVMRRFAAAEDQEVETVLESASFHVNNGGLTVQLIEKASYSPGRLDPYRNYVCRYSLTNMGARVVSEFDLGSVDLTTWMVGALSRVLRHIANTETTQSYTPYDRGPTVHVVDGVRRVASRFSAQAWLEGFEETLRLAEKESHGLPPGLVWQDRFASFFSDFDTRVANTLPEPPGRASLSAATTSFELHQHPEKGEHIAYRVADLKAWASAFGQWLDGVSS